MKKLSIKASMLLSIVLLGQYAVAFGASVVEKLTDALRGGDVEKVLSLINDAKELSYQGEAIQLMQSLWAGKGLPSGVSSSLIKKDIIRINAADYLVQAHNNGLLEVNKGEFQTFARKLLSSDDAEAVSASLFVLAHIDDPEDVKLIEPLVLSKSEYLFRSATLALAMMCNESADKALKELEEKVSESRRGYLVDTREKFLSMKEKGLYCH